MLSRDDYSDMDQPERLGPRVEPELWQQPFIQSFARELISARTLFECTRNRKKYDAETSLLIRNVAVNMWLFGYWEEPE